MRVGRRLRKLVLNVEENAGGWIDVGREIEHRRK